MKLFSTFFLLLILATAAQASLFVVNTDLDSETNGCGVGLCTLREAVNGANTSADSTDIFFSAMFFNQTRTITLDAAKGPLNFSAPNTVGTRVTSNTGNPVIISGGGATTVFTVNTNTRLTLENLSITGGNSGGFAGAGIFSAGYLTVNGCTLYGNNTNGGDGGAVAVNGTGAIFVLSRSSVSGNTAASGGGVRIFLGIGGISNSTITNNTATTDGGGVTVADGNRFDINNSIIAGNTDAAAPSNPDVFGTFSSQGYNLIGNVGMATGFTQATDQAGTTAMPINPMINALGFYGGPTQTHALLANSPAIDKGFSFGVRIDQRLRPRPRDLPDANYPNAPGGDASDIGSYEIEIATAAGVTVSGKVMMSTGKGLSRATVTMTDMRGQSRSVATNRTGYFTFADVRAGESYIFEVRSKGYHFNSQVITVTEDLDNVNFTATP